MQDVETFERKREAFFPHLFREAGVPHQFVGVHLVCLVSAAAVHRQVGEKRRHLRSRDAQDEDGKELGTVKDVIETGANDVYEVEMADGRSLLLPAIKQCILNVDVENGTMQVHVLEGLLDL